MPPLVAVVPLRSPGHGKTRLAPDLDRDTRAALAGAMLADVVAALRGADVQVVVAAGGASAASAASALAADVVVDGPGVRSLDDAVEHARRAVAPTTPLLVVQADLPGLTPDDVRAVVTTDAPVVVAPTADGGTSALLRRPSSAIRTAYGPDSAAAHLRLADAAGLEAATITRPGLQRDVDVLADLEALHPDAVGAATGALLRRLRDDAACA